MALQLTKRHFVSVPPVPGQESQVARYTVPKGYVEHFALHHRLSITIAVQEEFQLQAEADRDEVTVQLAGDIVQGPWPAERVAAATWRGQPTEVLSFDTQSNTVTVKVTDEEGVLVVYYLSGDGYIRIQKSMPAGSAGRQEAPVFEETLSILHRSDQRDEASLLRWMSDFNLYQDWSLVVYVNCRQAVAWDHPLTTFSAEFERATMEQLYRRAQASGITPEQILEAERARF